MADQLNMGGLSLDNRQGDGIGGRSTYIPPHMRRGPGDGADAGPPPAVNGSAQPNGSWGAPQG